MAAIAPCRIWRGPQPQLVDRRPGIGQSQNWTFAVAPVGISMMVSVVGGLLERAACSSPSG